MHRKTSIYVGYPTIQVFADNPLKVEGSHFHISPRTNLDIRFEGKWDKHGSGDMDLWHDLK